MRKIIIAGGGPAGLTAAIYASRAGLEPLVLSGPLPGGLLTQTTDVENFPGFPEGIGGFDLILNMQKQAKRFGTEFKTGSVAGVELVSGGPQKLTLTSGETLECRALIIAAGASPRPLGIPSEEKFRNRGVSSCATCDGAFYRDMEVAVVGGGDSAMEEAVFLTRFASRVTVIHRRDALRASPIMAERAKANPKIRFEWNSVVEEIQGKNEVEALKLKNTVTGESRLLPCQGCFIALGHIPNTKPFEGKIDMDPDGTILLQGASSLTSVEGVFACGDCCDRRYRQAVVAAGSGARAAIDAERFLEEHAK